MRFSELTNEKVNPKILDKDFHQETVVDSTLGPLKLVAKKFNGGMAPQIVITAYTTTGEDVGHVRFLVANHWTMNQQPEKKHWWSKKTDLIDPKDEPHLIAGSARVWPEYQRKGIATAIYKFAQSMGNDIKPSTSQTDQGKAMWQGFEKKKTFTEMELAVMEGGHSLLDKPTPSLASLAKKHKVDYKFLLDQLQKGMKIELEHTNDPKVAKEIALDHINEFPDYYDRLEKAEKPNGLREEENTSFSEMLKDFLPLAKKALGLKDIPPIKFQKYVEPGKQPTFGRYTNKDDTIYVGVENRHPMDILRTLAHELAHYKQDMKHMLDRRSGDTGSREEDQAHAEAGVIMRLFDKLHPNYFAAQDIDL